jgi:hypothetical protein
VFGVALPLNLVSGVALGTLIPLALQRSQLDPALAGGVLLAALTDAFGFSYSSAWAAHCCFSGNASKQRRRPVGPEASVDLQSKLTPCRRRSHAALRR